MLTMLLQELDARTPFLRVRNPEAGFSYKTSCFLTPRDHIRVYLD